MSSVWLPDYCEQVGLSQMTYERTSRPSRQWAPLLTLESGVASHTMPTPIKHTSSESPPSLQLIPRMTLPQELLGTIIDHLYHEGDIFSLKMCSLVCASFCHSSQPHIFRRVTLQPWLMPGTSSKRTMSFLFHRLVTRSPHILLYVRILVIRDRELYSRPGRRLARSWMLDEPTLPLLLQMLPNIVGFHLHARINWGILLQNSPS